MAKSIFFKLIKCKCCGYNYKSVKERKVSSFVCSGYSRGLPDSCKDRFSVKESELLYLVQIYCNRNKIELIKTNEFMNDIINHIYVNREKESIIIEYKNGEKGVYAIEIHI